MTLDQIYAMIWLPRKAGVAMDRLQRGFFRQAAQIKYLMLKRTEFQAWFTKVMEKCHPVDYVNIRLTQGDGGLDGLLVLDGAVFAAFAPRDMSEAEAVQKMADDFAAASKTMRERKAVLKKLAFVHNDEGLTKVTGPELLRLTQENPGVIFEMWTFERIWIELEKLSVDQLTDLLGPGPTEENVDQLGFPSIRDVIEWLARKEVPIIVPLAPPDPKKLEHNKLAPSQEDMLQIGRRRQGLVEGYLNGMYDPISGEAIAEAFRQRYALLRDSGLSNNAIFDALWRFAGGEHFVQPHQTAAVTAVLAYFFSTCDIFENLPKDK
jgi:hypothetical protein